MERKVLAEVKLFKRTTIIVFALCEILCIEFTKFTGNVEDSREIDEILQYIFGEFKNMAFYSFYIIYLLIPYGPFSIIVSFMYGAYHMSLQYRLICKVLTSTQQDFRTRSDSVIDQDDLSGILKICVRHQQNIKT